MKSAIFGTSEASDLDLHLGSGHTAFRRASVINVYLHIKLKSEKLFIDGWTYVRMYGHTY